ncbi:hypothetical protein CIHG_07454 [Coccidioides immitis H538.4]|uniref:Uncharacterized protein n=3 Tax=Coccidioides immitis TaxID=5501 RepID=A0A0J8U2P4_COCIT|nr:hypothetical protein CIRG_02407 [Coccidioides immitis RMSCC 2394]KMU80927.1 hypothetical protein CISG_08823 [Coccidioides immitis RMSCC 3703]KMU89647.1 hypothetical protein CIHG_07454 [Coccidioides immitis H538.4]
MGWIMMSPSPQSCWDRCSNKFRLAEVDTPANDCRRARRGKQDRRPPESQDRFDNRMLEIGYRYLISDGSGFERLSRTPVRASAVFKGEVLGKDWWRTTPWVFDIKYKTN